MLQRAGLEGRDDVLGKYRSLKESNIYQ